MAHSLKADQPEHPKLVASVNCAHCARGVAKEDWGTNLSPFPQKVLSELSDVSAVIGLSVRKEVSYARKKVFCEEKAL